MNRLALILTAFIAVTATVIADYVLNPVVDRVVMLVDLATSRLDMRDLVIQHGTYTNQIVVNRFLMQDRIYSDGICTLISDDDPKSSAFRINHVQHAIANQKSGQLLIEIVWQQGSDRWHVSYLKLFDADIEYSRYFPNQESYDTIALPKGISPTSPADFVSQLEQITLDGWKTIQGEPQHVPPAGRGEAPRP